MFSQGDPADRYYVIEDGVADVVGDGQLVARLGPGDGFGEIALPAPRVTDRDGTGGNQSSAADADQ